MSLPVSCCSAPCLHAFPCCGASAMMLMSHAAGTILVFMDLTSFACHLDLAVLQATGLQVSANARHILYRCTCWPGGPEPAVMLYEGKVAAMHQDGVNHVREVICQQKDTNTALTAVQESLQSMVESAAQGAVGLLASSFP